MTNYKSAGVWVRASERMPRAKAHVKWRWAVTHVEVEYSFVRELFKGENDHKTKFEWLDESTPSDTFSREQVEGLLKFVINKIGRKYSLEGYTPEELLNQYLTTKNEWI